MATTGADKYKPMQIAVVGAGVVGLSVAYMLSERIRSRATTITILADRFSPNTTSDKAAALTVPFELCEGELDPREKGWLERSIAWFGDVYNSQECCNTGVTLANGCLSLAGSSETPWWRNSMLGFQEMTANEKQLMNIPSEYEHVYSFSSYMVDCRVYLPWLMGCFQRNGGIVQLCHISSLDELTSYDVVINCTGLDSRYLASDSGVYPTRGDAVIVQAPWIRQFVFLINKDVYTYVFPRSTSVLCGGSGRDHNWSELPERSATEDIMKRCTAIVPSLASCTIVKEYAGLRPMRSRVRLEALTEGRRTIVHCYGHGGKGITYSWGCADDVCTIVEKIVLHHCSKL